MTLLMSPLIARGDFVVKGNGSMKKSSRLYIRPNDSSYGEYVNLIKTMCEHLGVQFDLSDEKLREGYQKYLAKKESAQKTPQSPLKRTSTH